MVSQNKDRESRLVRAARQISELTGLSLEKIIDYGYVLVTNPKNQRFGRIGIVMNYRTYFEDGKLMTEYFVGFKNRKKYGKHCWLGEKDILYGEFFKFNDIGVLLKAYEKLKETGQGQLF